jgi:hypothetical protein
VDERVIAGGAQPAADDIGDAGVRERLADDQYGGHGDDRRVAEAAEDRFDRQQAGEGHRQQGHEGDDIIAKTSPDEHCQRRQQDSENQDLVVQEKGSLRKVVNGKDSRLCGKDKRPVIR